MSNEQRVPFTVLPVPTGVPPTVHVNVMADGPTEELASTIALELPT